MLIALLASPNFSIEYRNYNTWGDGEKTDITTWWIKRSLIESFELPQLTLDELTWLQSNHSETYIPAQVYCPRRSVRLIPLFGMIRSDYLVNALASSKDDETGRASEADVTEAIARCNLEGPAMLEAGHTKESALMEGDIERFFHLNALEAFSKDSIVLEDASIPAPIMAKIENTLSAANYKELWNYIDGTGYKENPYRVRRLKPLLLAKALKHASAGD